MTTRTYTVTNNLDSGGGSFRLAIDDANLEYNNGDTIYVNFSSNYNVLVNTPIVVTAPMIIRGNSSALTGSGQYSLLLFTIATSYTDKRIEMNNITLSNGVGHNISAAITSGNADLQLHNVTINNCNSTVDTDTTNGFGAALTVRNGRLIMSKCNK
jgi:hypothetical protein